MGNIIDTIGKFFSEQNASSSPEAYDINSLFSKFLIFSAVIVLLIGGLIFISVVRFRDKKQPNEPRQVFGSKWLEITWTVLPFLVVTFFFVLAVNTMKAISQPIDQGRQADVVITGRQWWWDIKYTKENIRTANELHLPLGKKLLVRFESADVIHDWWVPDLGPKTDVVPGRVNFLWMNPTKSGTYEGACSEYCGTQHAWMRMLTIVQNQGDYDRWIKEEQNHSTNLDALGKKGEELFREKTCTNCHSVEDTPQSAYIGPDLRHISSRQTLLSGMMPNTKENLTRWLKDPQKVKEGAHMPNFMLSQDELQAIVAYLEELR